MDYTVINKTWIILTGGDSVNYSILEVDQVLSYDESYWTKEEFNNEEDFTSRLIELGVSLEENQE